MSSLRTTKKKCETKGCRKFVINPFPLPENFDKLCRFCKPVDFIIEDEKESEVRFDDLINEIKNMETILKLKGGYRDAVTPCGYSFSTMKSALQKYLRRGNFEMALRVAFELDCMNWLDEATAKAHVTNFYNRLLIIFSEDIGVTGFKYIGRIKKLFDELYKKKEERKNLEKYGNKWIECRSIEIRSIAEIIWIMCNSVKTRAASHYKCVFKISPSHNILSDPIIKKVYNLSKNIEDINYKMQEIDESEEIKIYVKNFLYNLEQLDDILIFWAFKIAESEVKNKYYRKKKSAYLIFWLLEQFFKRDNKLLEIIKINMEWYDKISHLPEGFIYWINPLIFILEKKPKIEEKIEFKEEIESKYREVLNGKEIKLDEWVFDMHTIEWKNKKNPKIYFANVSSVVLNEDQSINKQYKEIYIKVKYLCDGKSEYDFQSDYKK